MHIKDTIGAILPAVLCACLIGMASAAQAQIEVKGDQPRTLGVPQDFGSLGSETSSAAMECWQDGKEVFSADDFNTVLLGGLASESAITLTNNVDGGRTLAISLDNGLCFVTIEP